MEDVITSVASVKLGEEPQPPKKSPTQAILDEHFRTRTGPSETWHEQLTLLRPERVWIDVSIAAIGPADSLILTYAVYHGTEKVLAFMDTQGCALSDNTVTALGSEIHNRIHAVLASLEAF